MKYHSETLRSFNEDFDIILEESNEHGVWEKIWTTNEMSNDYAYTDLKNKVRQILNPGKRF